MKLYEYEGKQLLKSVGVPVPDGRVIGSAAELGASDGPIVVKAQALAGKRGKAGLISLCRDRAETEAAVKKALGAEHQGEKITKVLLEQGLQIKEEHYACITYDTLTRSPLLIFCLQGGMDIEEVKAQNPEKVRTQPIDLNFGLQPWQVRQTLNQAGVSGMKLIKLTEFLTRMWACFQKYDCRTVEVNPLVETEEGDLFACDAKVVLDEDALYRHPDLEFPPRSPGRKQTEKELQAKEIDKNDHRGSVGSTYIDLPGDIGILASGGGASIVIMDAMLEAGGKPANFTEYSGNPPGEKVEKLTKIVMDKPGLNGCWVVGGTANFTDIYVTLIDGFLKGLRQIKPKPDYPIVIRRGGPRDEEAFKALREAAAKEGWDFHIYGRETSMTSTAKILIDLVNAYKKKKGLK